LNVIYNITKYKNVKSYNHYIELREIHMKIKIKPLEISMLRKRIDMLEQELDDLKDMVRYGK